MSSAIYNLPDSILKELSSQELNEFAKLLEYFNELNITVTNHVKLIRKNLSDIYRGEFDAKTKIINFQNYIIKYSSSNVNGLSGTFPGIPKFLRKFDKDIVVNSLAKEMEPKNKLTEMIENIKKIIRFTEHSDEKKLKEIGLLLM